LERINKGIDKKLFEEIININLKTPFHRFMDMNVTALGKGWAEMVLEVRKEHTNPLGIAHGGVAFSLLDTAMGMAVRTMGFEVTTIEMNINYLSPGRIGTRMRAEGKLVHLGKKIIVAEGEIYREDGKLMAKARETFYNLGEFTGAHSILNKGGEKTT